MQKRDGYSKIQFDFARISRYFFKKNLHKNTTRKCGLDIVVFNYFICFLGFAIFVLCNQFQADDLQQFKFGTVDGNSSTNV
jgi:hypothetical protein